MGLRIKNGTESAATTADETLELGEQGYESDTGRWKVGDGVTAWTSLDYSIYSVHVGTTPPANHDWLWIDTT